MIPKKEPQVNGGVEDCNGRFQPRLFDRRYARPGDLRRELARLQETVNTQHVHPRLGGRTPAQHRRGLWLRKPPASFVVPTKRLPLAADHVTFRRCASTARTVNVLNQFFRAAKNYQGLPLRLVMDTAHGWLTGYQNGRVLKRWAYKLPNNELTSNPAAAGGSGECSGQRCGYRRKTHRS